MNARLVHMQVPTTPGALRCCFQVLSRVLLSPDLAEGAPVSRRSAGIGEVGAGLREQRL